MSKVTVSSKYQVVIPKDVRAKARVRKGEKLIALVKDGVISLVAERPLKYLKGAFKGLRPGGLREKRDR